MGELNLTFEIASLAVLTAIMIGDLLLILRRPHEPSLKESAWWTVFYIALALAFGGVLWVMFDADISVKYVTGYLLEKSLSLDNLFVFMVIMNRFAVPRKYQQEVLMVGIIIALIARFIFIFLGAAIVEHFAGVFYIFGLFLLYTAWKQAADDDDEGSEDGRLTRWLQARLPLTDEYDEGKIRTTVDGKRVFTPMLMVFLAIGLTDVMFALDSIPAIFGITTNPFIVFTTNIFALMGLRQMYFLLGGLIGQLKYLHYGIAAILAFIGVKLIIHAIHEAPLSFIPGFDYLKQIPEIPIWLSLSFIVLAMVVATVASVMAKDDADPEEKDDEQYEVTGGR